MACQTRFRHSRGAGSLHSPHCRRTDLGCPAPSAQLQRYARSRQAINQHRNGHVTSRNGFFHKTVSTSRLGRVVPGVQVARAAEAYGPSSKSQELMHTLRMLKSDTKNANTPSVSR